jgi:hypothetical protein
MSVIPLKSLEDVLKPDDWWDAFVMFDGKSIRKIKLADHFTRIDAVRLREYVPEKVRQLFENARNAYLYAFFAHRLLPVADLQVYASVEFALREKARAAGKQIPDWWGMGRLFELAIERRWIVDDGFEVFRRNELGRKREAEELSQIDPKLRYESPTDRQAYCRILADSFPSLRNTLAHGSNMLHPSVIGTFEIAADLIHQLFPAQDASSNSSG